MKARKNIMMNKYKKNKKIKNKINNENFAHHKRCVTFRKQRIILLIPPSVVFVVFF